MADNQSFEVPQQLRDLAERNVEQGRAAYAQFMDAMVQATSMWWGAMPANELTSGFKVVQERSVRFAKQTPMPVLNLRASWQTRRTSRTFWRYKADMRRLRCRRSPYRRKSLGGS